MFNPLIAAVLLAWAAQAAAQQPNDEQPAGSDGVTVQSGAAGKALSGKAQEGTAGPTSGTLMDKRSKALSPEAASGGKTGQVTQ